MIINKMWFNKKREYKKSSTKEEKKVIDKYNDAAKGLNKLFDGTKKTAGIDDTIKYYLDAKGKRPDVISVKDDDFDKLLTICKMNGSDNDIIIYNDVLLKKASGMLEKYILDEDVVKELCEAYRYDMDKFHVLIKKIFWDECGVVL